MRLISLGTTGFVNPDHIVQLHVQLAPERNKGVVIIHLTVGPTITYHLDKPGVALAKQADDLIKSIVEASNRG